MAVKVVVHTGASEPPHLTFDAPRVVIGRSDGCEVRLPDPSVSQRHASIRQRGAEYLVLDEGSTNGTFVGQVRLSAGAPRLLRDGDRIRVGRIWLSVHIETAPVTQNPAIATKELALALVAEGLAAQGEPSAMRALVESGPGAGSWVELVESERPYVIGRGKGADLSIDDADLSRRHVQIVRKADRAFVRDLGSKNGSMLDDTPVGSEREVPWSSKRKLRIGESVLVLEDPVREALSELDNSDDERLADDEPVERPPGDADEEASEVSTDEARPAPPPHHPAPRPPDRSAPPVGWTATDYLVAFLAIVVLGLSLVALFWLVQSG